VVNFRELKNELLRIMLNTRLTPLIRPLCFYAYNHKRLVVISRKMQAVTNFAPHLNLIFRHLIKYDFARVNPEHDLFARCYRTFSNDKHLNLVTWNWSTVDYLSINCSPNWMSADGQITNYFLLLS
jgi:hypothetical protein